jgi:hypothetical protein
METREIFRCRAEKEKENMQSLIPIILIALFGYLIIFRKGGMGCCGGHGKHEAQQNQDEHLHKPFHDRAENVIELREDEYSVLHSKVQKPRRYR